jgi:hypothetical protein
LSCAGQLQLSATEYSGTAQDKLVGELLNRYKALADIRKSVETPAAVARGGGGVSAGGGGSAREPRAPRSYQGNPGSEISNGAPDLTKLANDLLGTETTNQDPQSKALTAATSWYNKETARLVAENFANQEPTASPFDASEKSGVTSPELQKYENLLPENINKWSSGGAMDQNAWQNANSDTGGGLLSNLGTGAALLGSDLAKGAALYASDLGLSGQASAVNAEQPLDFSGGGS